MCWGAANNGDSKFLTASMDVITMVWVVMLMMLMHSSFGILKMLVQLYVLIPFLLFCCSVWGII